MTQIKSDSRVHHRAKPIEVKEPKAAPKDAPKAAPKRKATKSKK